MSYFTIKNHAESSIEEKKSLFIGNTKRVYNEEAARAFINKVKSEQKEANHNVYAYIIGENKGTQRYSDDGEPQGTAGIPVLEVLKKNDVTDVVVVVTRYFGGVLLGAGGLVRAYSKAAANVVKEAGIVEKVKGCALYVSIDYDLLGKLQYLCSQNEWHIEGIEYFERVRLKLFAEASRVDVIKKEMFDVSSGRTVFETKDEKFFFKQENRLYEGE